MESLTFSFKYAKSQLVFQFPYLIANGSFGEIEFGSGSRDALMTSNSGKKLLVCRRI